MKFSNGEKKNFLSTFYPCKIFIDGITWENLQEYINNLAAESEFEGKVPNYERLFINANLQKFLQNLELKSQLLKISTRIYSTDTYNKEFIESDYLGKVLTCIRDILYKMHSITICSWNINGIRSKILGDTICKKKGETISQIPKDSNMGKLIELDNPDIICLQETRCGENIYNCIDLEEFPYQYWNCSTCTERGRGSGYSGTSIWSKIEPKTVLYDLPTLKEKNKAGRIVIAEFDKFTLINIYAPNSGSNEEYRVTVWDPALLRYIKILEKKTKVIICGDFNVAHNSKDIWFRKVVGNKRIAGFLPEERENFNKYLKIPLLDIFREQHPEDINAFTFWPMINKVSREINKGWRIDYFLVSSRLKSQIIASNILTNIFGSDHCPISIIVI